MFKWITRILDPYAACFTMPLQLELIRMQAPLGSVGLGLHHYFPPETVAKLKKEREERMTPISFQDLEAMKRRNVDAAADMIRVLKELERLRGGFLRIENVRLDTRTEAEALDRCECIAREMLGV